MAKYKLTLSLSNGNTINAGTFETFTAADKEAIVADVIAALGGSPVFGVVDSDNNITLSGLADGAYTLKYEQTDGTTTEIGALTVGEVAPAYTNIAKNGTWEINYRYNSSFQKVAANGMAIFKVPVSGLLTSDPNIVRIKFGNSNISLKDSDAKELWQYGSTVKTYQYTTYKGAGGSYVTQDSNGVWQYNIAYISDYNANTNYALNTAYSSITHIGFVIDINNGTAITEADLPEVIMTINEEIVD